MIKKYFIICFVLFLSGKISAQPTYAILDPEKKYKVAEDLFLREQYQLAFPLFQELKKQYVENEKSDHTFLYENVNYYYSACVLKMQHPLAEEEALGFLEKVDNDPLNQRLSFHLAQFYFKKNNYEKAIVYYERAGLDNLTNAEIADAKFETAYCYFNVKRFKEAKSLFNEIHQLPGNKYYLPANYYYAFLSYYDKQFDEALQAFKVVEKEKAYRSVVPYYIAEIYYYQGKKEDALTYSEQLLRKQPDLYYAKEIKLLIGQIYFEKKNFSKASPLLEEYIKKTPKADKKIVYELSYCYFETNQLTKAIDGFKQLSNEKDSMGQNSMYLLGDCYLKTGQKQNARNAFQYCAYNSTNALQQKISRFNYAKLSYELGFQNIALAEIREYITDYPNSEYDNEAKEILADLLSNTNNFSEAMAVLESIKQPSATIQRLYPKVLYGKAMQLINDQQITEAEALLDKILADPNAKEIIPYANFWKGEIAYRKAQYEEAIKYLSSYLQTNSPTLGEVNAKAAKYTLGYCFLKKENFVQALSNFEQVASSISAKSSAVEQDAFLRSADCYFMKKDFIKAGSMYDVVVNTQLSSSDYALFQKAMVVGVKNTFEKIKLLNSIFRLYPNSSLSADVNMEIANTFMSDEKFREAIPYLKAVIGSNTAGLHPKAYLKSGLCYYNLDQNNLAIENYQVLLQKYPASSEADEALDNIKNIYVEEGTADKYVDLLKKNGRNIAVTEADSLTYAAAFLKYNAGDCTAAQSALDNYLKNYPQGNYTIDATFYKSECCNKNNDSTTALAGYEWVSAKGNSPYFEKATLEAAKLSYLHFRDYVKAKQYFEALRSNAIRLDMRLEALRGLVRCYYQLKDYTQANLAAKELLANKNIATDDKAIAFLVLGKSQQMNKDCENAIASFKSCAAINKTAWGAEARYEIAHCYLDANDFKSAEKAALTVIKETSAYDYWVTKSYILLGDIFMAQKDYFNAKATYESVAKNAAIEELKQEAQQKLETAIAQENNAPTNK